MKTIISCSPSFLHTFIRRCMLASCWLELKFIHSARPCHAVQADLCQLPAGEGQAKLIGVYGTDQYIITPPLWDLLPSFISIKHSGLHSQAAYSPGIPSSTIINTLWQDRADDLSDNQMLLWCFHICSLYNQADRFEPLRAHLSRGSEKHLEQLNDSRGCVINTQVWVCRTILKCSKGWWLSATMVVCH